MNNNFTDEIIPKVIRFKELLDKGAIAQPKDIIDTYNKVFNGKKKPQPFTTCGSCCKRCIREMWNEYTQYLTDIAVNTPIEEPTTTQTNIVEELPTEPKKRSRKA